MEELKSCPFCGSTVTIKNIDSTGRMKYIACPDDSSCKGSGLGVVFTPYNEKTAIKQWNTRPTPDSIDIEWVGECPQCELGIIVSLDKGKIIGRRSCPKCNGKGTITRPATLKEIKEAIKWLPNDLIVNGGTLRVKDNAHER